MNDVKLQQQYLAQLRDNHIPLAMYLINGIKLSGVIADFDETVVILKDNKNTIEQLIYKHAIATIVPHKAANQVNHSESAIKSHD